MTEELDVRSLHWGAVAIAGVLLSACTTGSGTLEALRERGAGGGSARPYDSLDDLLGNVRYQWSVGQPRPLTIAVVVGRFESAGPGAAFTVAGADAPGGRSEDFDAPAATWKTVEATFVVDQVISGAVDRADRVEVGLAFGPDIDPAAVEDDLRRLGRTVLFLDKSPVFGYKPQLYGTVADGTLLATVADDGTLALPALDTDQAASLLRAHTNTDHADHSGIRNPSQRHHRSVRSRSDQRDHRRRVMAPTGARHAAVGRRSNWPRHADDCVFSGASSPGLVSRSWLRPHDTRGLHRRGHQ